MNGVHYYKCGSTWYNRVIDGTNVSYVIVSAPAGLLSGEGARETARRPALAAAGAARGGRAAPALARVHAQDLTPWCGGGFGMFSTTDGRFARHLHVVAQSPGLRIELGIPAALDERVLKRGGAARETRGCARSRSTSRRTRSRTSSRRSRSGSRSSPRAGTRRRSRPRACCCAPSRCRLRDLDPVDLARKLTLADLALQPIGAGWLRPALLGLAVLGLVLPSASRRAWFWLVLAALAACRVFSTWPLADNHAYLLVYWCLAVAIAIARARPDSRARVERTRADRAGVRVRGAVEGDLARLPRRSLLPRHARARLATRSVHRARRRARTTTSCTNGASCSRSTSTASVAEHAAAARGARALSRRGPARDLRHVRERSAARARVPVAARARSVPRSRSAARSASARSPTWSRPSAASAGS